MPEAPAPVVEFVGVYDADGTVVGELRYWFGARVGVRHCALCDITHGLVREKAEWRAAMQTVGVPVQMLHRDETTPAQAAACTGALPCVLAQRADGTVAVVVTAAVLEAMDGDPARLADALRAVV